MRSPILILIFVSVLFAPMGCRKQGIINESKMEAILYDLHLADALIEKEQKKGILSDSIHNSLYASILRKHSITKEQFDSSLSWYGSHLDRYIRIYKNLNTRFARETDHYDRLLAEQSNRLDTAEMWKGEPQLLFVNHMFPLIVPFNDSIPGEVKNNDSFTLSFRVFGINPQMKRFPRVAVSLRYADTTDIKKLSIGSDDIYTLTLPVIPDKKLDEVSGYFYVRPHHNNFYRVLFDSISLKHISQPKQ